MAKLLGCDASVEYLLPVLLLLLRDEASDVRLGVISALAPVHDAIGIELLSQSLLPAMVTLAEDVQWRVRFSILSQVPQLAQQLGPVFFQKNFGDKCMNWLKDPVYSVRRTATENLTVLCEQFGHEWTEQYLLPHIKELVTSNNYLHRITGLYGLRALVTSLGGHALEPMVVPSLLKAGKDGIPNVRLVAARAFRSVLWGRGSAAAQVRPPLEQMAESDDDKDVRDEAMWALEGPDDRVLPHVTAE